MFRRILLVLLLSVVASAVEARPLRVATWNLGWHLSQAEAETWISKCDAPFAKDPQSGIWKPAASGTPGWKLEWGRDAKNEWDIGVWPPCDVFGTFDAIPATPTAYASRANQIRTIIRDELYPDVIAFQEVSGEQSIREVLPCGADEYLICSFSGYKVQRLAFAWRKTLGAGTCAVEDALSLPAVSAVNRVRPGLMLSLKIDGKDVRFLNVHLKSSCVSPLEGPRGDLMAAQEACEFLQQQVGPLEAWVEATASVTNRFIVLGDFNRNLWHERVDRSPVRSDGSSPSSPLPAGVKVSSIFEEVGDGSPGRSDFLLLHEDCPQNGFIQATCATGEVMALTRPETRALGFEENLGCSLPFGLDHILVGLGFSVQDNAVKVALGAHGRSLPPSAAFPNPRLAVSDHCPTVATVHLN